MFDHKHLRLGLPVEGTNFWSYKTGDKPAEVEEPGYFDKGERINGLAEDDYIFVKCRLGDHKGATTLLTVDYANSGEVRITRIFPWSRTGAAPLSDMPDNENDMIEEVIGAIERMHPRHYRTDGRPKHHAFQHFLKYQPSPEVIDKAMSVIEDKKRREEDEKRFERERKQQEADEVERRRRMEASREVMENEPETEQQAKERQDAEVPLEEPPPKPSFELMDDSAPEVRSGEPVPQRERDW